MPRTLEQEINKIFALTTNYTGEVASLFKSLLAEIIQREDTIKTLIKERDELKKKYEPKKIPESNNETPKTS
jgi:SMC interacting uncharacterized protein involved in chromosome segregation